MNLPAPIVPSSEVSLIDQRAVALGCDIGELMERAGAAICAHVREHYPASTVLICCGPGNNGGDGYVAARLLAERGQSVAIWPVSEAKSTLCKQQAQSLPKNVHVITSPNELTQVDLIIDAILGAGSTGHLRHHIKQALDALRHIDCPVLAVDIPTGSESGEALDCAHTITFQVAKQALHNIPHTVVDIGIPSAAYCDTSSSLMQLFPRHQRNSHKGNNGSVFCLSGWQYPGARHYSSMAALRSGCDLIHCWVRPQDQIDHACIRQEIGQSQLANVIERSDVLLIGPGMGRTHKTIIEECFQIARDYEKPCVIDADAIHQLKFHLRSNRHPPVLITPHRGELAALLSKREIQEADIHELAQANKVILAKAAVDFISDGQQWQRNPYGNPRMAVGGTGDILAGMCAGLIARGLSLFDAARLAAYWSCSSADRLWHSHGPTYVPDDIINELGIVLRDELSAFNAWPPHL